MSNLRLGRTWRRSGRGGVAVAALACLAVAVILGLRPDLFPFRFGRAALEVERTGEPGVVAGAGFVTPTRLSNRPEPHQAGSGRAWRATSAAERPSEPGVVDGAGFVMPTRLSDHPGRTYQTGEFDGVPGEEVAAIGGGMIALLDPMTGAERHRVAMTAEALRRWHPSSRLFRNGRNLHFFQSYSFQTYSAEVFDLDGTTRWLFPRDARALTPRDLDLDGRVEFYASSKDTVYRLDEAGNVVWERAVEDGVRVLDATRSHSGSAAILLGRETGGQFFLWDPAGQPVGSLAFGGTLVDWPHGLAFKRLGPTEVGGRTLALRVFDPDGLCVLDHPIGDSFPRSTVAVRFEPGARPHLAAMTGAPRADGWRLLIFSARGHLVYEEILARAGTLAVATDPASGRQSLLLADASGLVAYRR